MQRKSRTPSPSNAVVVPYSTSATTISSGAAVASIDRISSQHRSLPSSIDRQHQQIIATNNDFIHLSSSIGSRPAIPMERLSSSIRDGLDDDDNHNSSSSPPPMENKSPIAVGDAKSVSSSSSSSSSSKSGISVGTAGVTTADGVSPVVSVSDEEVALSNSVLRIKILIGLLLVRNVSHACMPY
jgi:hypothetical protein